MRLFNILKITKFELPNSSGDGSTTTEAEGETEAEVDTEAVVPPATASGGAIASNDMLEVFTVSAQAKSIELTDEKGKPNENGATLIQLCNQVESKCASDSHYTKEEADALIAEAGITDASLKEIAKYHMEDILNVAKKRISKVGNIKKKLQKAQKAGILIKDQTLLVSTTVPSKPRSGESKDLAVPETDPEKGTIKMKLRTEKDAKYMISEMLKLNGYDTSKKYYVTLPKTKEGDVNWKALRDLLTAMEKFELGYNVKDKSNEGNLSLAQINEKVYADQGKKPSNKRGIGGFIDSITQSGAVDSVQKNLGLQTYKHRVRVLRLVAMQEAKQELQLGEFPSINQKIQAQDLARTKLEKLIVEHKNNRPQTDADTMQIKILEEAKAAILNPNVVRFGTTETGKVQLEESWEKSCEQIVRTTPNYNVEAHKTLSERLYQNRVEVPGVDEKMQRAHAASLAKSLLEEYKPLRLAAEKVDGLVNAYKNRLTPSQIEAVLKSVAADDGDFQQPTNVDEKTFTIMKELEREAKTGLADVRNGLQTMHGDESFLSKGSGSTKTADSFASEKIGECIESNPTLKAMDKLTEDVKSDPALKGKFQILATKIADAGKKFEGKDAAVKGFKDDVEKGVVGNLRVRTINAMPSGHPSINDTVDKVWDKLMQNRVPDHTLDAPEIDTAKKFLLENYTAGTRNFKDGNIPIATSNAEYTFIPNKLPDIQDKPNDNDDGLMAQFSQKMDQELGVEPQLKGEIQTKFDDYVGATQEHSELHGNLADAGLKLELNEADTNAEIVVDNVENLTKYVGSHLHINLNQFCQSVHDELQDDEEREQLDIYCQTSSYKAEKEELAALEKQLENTTTEFQQENVKKNPIQARARQSIPLTKEQEKKIDAIKESISEKKKAVTASRERLVSIPLGKEAKDTGTTGAWEQTKAWHEASEGPLNFTADEAEKCTQWCREHSADYDKYFGTGASTGSGAASIIDGSTSGSTSGDSSVSTQSSTATDGNAPPEKLKALGVGFVKQFVKNNADEKMAAAVTTVHALQSELSKTTSRFDEKAKQNPIRTGAKELFREAKKDFGISQGPTELEAEQAAQQVKIDKTCDGLIDAMHEKAEGEIDIDRKYTTKQLVKNGYRYDDPSTAQDHTTEEDFDAFEERANIVTEVTSDTTKQAFQTALDDTREEGTHADFNEAEEQECTQWCLEHLNDNPKDFIPENTNATTADDATSADSDSSAATDVDASTDDESNTSKDAPPKKLQDLGLSFVKKLMENFKGELNKYQEEGSANTTQLHGGDEDILAPQDLQRAEKQFAEVLNNNRAAAILEPEDPARTMTAPTA